MEIETMIDERHIYLEDENSGTWTIGVLIVGAILVMVALYLGGVFTQGLDVPTHRANVSSGRTSGAPLP
jgi:hypothetical protein